MNKNQSLYLKEKRKEKENAWSRSIDNLIFK
jgi:hypothetical protein